MKDNITVILTVYKRPIRYVEEQLVALKAQTIQAEDIWIWYNKPEDKPHENLARFNCKVIYSTHNFKFHGRFMLAMLAKTKYVAIFDDDTIPSTKWFESCLNTIKNGCDGILGATGVILERKTSYVPHTKYGWNGKRNETPIEVDLVGHAWFLNKNYLRYLCYEEPIMYETGEDMQLSFFAQKHGNIKTYVPPHPNKDRSLWGSDFQKGMAYGTDNCGASSATNGKKSLEYRNKCVKECVDNGWKLVKVK